MIKFDSEVNSSLLAYSLPNILEQYTNIPLYYYLANPEDNKQYTLEIATDGNVITTLDITTNTLQDYSLYFENKGSYNLTLSILELGISCSTIITIAEYTGELPVIDPNN
jgi:hypothetical protein